MVRGDPSVLVVDSNRNAESLGSIRRERERSSEKMKATPHAMLVATMLLGLLAGFPVSAGTPDEKRSTDTRLEGGARSVDQLIAQALRALRNKDTNALRELRVTEKEYREIILPGSARPGESPVPYASGFTEYLWSSLSAKNFHGEQRLVRGVGGKVLTLRETSLQRERELAGYTSYGRVELTLTDEEGHEVLLEMGSIAKVGDRYKFVSFVRN
jgi:hypothetical protein